MTQEKKILLVDDEPNITHSIKRICRGKGYDIHLAESAAEALEIIAKEDIQVILCDQLMPKMTGSELFEKIQIEFPCVIRILLTGYTAIEGLTSAVNKGAVFRILFKPWDDELLLQTIDDAFEYFFIRDTNKQLTEELKLLNANLESKVAEKTRELSLHINRLQLSHKLFELLPSFSIGISDDFYIVNANKKAHDIIGSLALIGQRIDDILPLEAVKLIHSLESSGNNDPHIQSVIFQNISYQFIAIKTEISKDCFAYLLYVSNEK
ncbi:MAG: response regulator RpfG family c-di-GMP phosphodiesterase [Oleiphilaceae bacterium]